MATYACSDLHGNWELWVEIKKFLKPDDTLYYLGDSTDRGPEGWAILKEMLSDSRINYIVGNHDIILADRINNPNDYNIANLHHFNGGFLTWLAAKEDPEAEAIKNTIYSLPLYAIYENADGLKIFMSHSGSVKTDNKRDLLWERNGFIRDKNYSEYDIIVHGHTPIPFLIKNLKDLEGFFPKFKVPTWKGGAYWYHGYRCDLDCNTIQTGLIVLLNLDTFEETIFKI